MSHSRNIPNIVGVMLLVRNNVVHVIARYLHKSNPALTTHIITLIQNLSFSSHPRVCVADQLLLTAFKGVGKLKKGKTP